MIMHTIRIPVVCILNHNLNPNQRTAFTSAANALSRFGVEVEVASIKRDAHVPYVRNSTQFEALAKSPNEKIVKGDRNLLGDVFGPYPLNYFGILVDSRQIVTPENVPLIGFCEIDSRSSYKVVGAVVSASIDPSIIEAALIAQFFKLLIKTNPSHRCQETYSGYRESASSCIFSSPDAAASFSIRYAASPPIPCQSCSEAFVRISKNLSYACGA